MPKAKAKLKNTGMTGDDRGRSWDPVRGRYLKNHLRMAFGFAFEQSSVRYGTYMYIAVDRITDIGSDRLTVLHVHSKRAIFFVYLRS